MECDVTAGCFGALRQSGDRRNRRHERSDFEDEEAMIGPCGRHDPANP